MKQRGHCGPAREDRARKDAQVLLRAGRELAAGQDADGEPMRRYTYPVGPVGVRSGQEAGDTDRAKPAAHRSGGGGELSDLGGAGQPVPYERKRMSSYKKIKFQNCTLPGGVFFAILFHVDC